MAVVAEAHTHPAAATAAQAAAEAVEAIALTTEPVALAVLTPVLLAPAQAEGLQEPTPAEVAEPIGVTPVAIPAVPEAAA